MKLGKLSNHYEIIKQWYKTIPIGKEGWVVYGEITFREMELKTFPLDIHSRFSMVCENTKEGLKLIHAHFSEQNEVKNEHEFDHKALIRDYDAKLETALKERTELLVRNIEELRISQMRYEIAMENTDVIIFDYIVATKQSIYPKAIGEKYGIHHIVEDTVETAIRKGLVHPKSIVEFREIYKKIERGEPFAEGVFVFIDKNGNERINEIFFTSIFDINRKPIRAIGLLRDVTEQKNLKREKDYRMSMTQDKKFAYEANVSQNTLNTLDMDWFEMLGIPQGYSFSEMIQYIMKNNVHPDYTSLFRDFNSKGSIEKAFDNHMIKLHIQYLAKNLNQKYLWVQNTMCIVQDDITGDIKIRCYLKNIHEKKQKEKALIYKSEHDTLTKLYNKEMTEILIKKYLVSEQGIMEKHAFFMIDIDYFKDINDSFGHDFGDKLLAEIARKIKDVFRENDIIGRIGGDEFVVLMKNISIGKVAMSKAQQLCNAIKATYSRNNVKQELSASVGIALYPEHGKVYESLYHRSDTALYIGKKNGRNQFTLYEKNKKEALKTGIVV